MATTEHWQPYGLGISDRVALVTGGTRGIGTAICHQLADGAIPDQIQHGSQS